MKCMLTDIKGHAMCSETVNARKESSPRGTIRSSTRGTRIMFAGMDTTGSIPNEFIIKGKVTNVAAHVVFMRVAALSFSVPNLKGKKLCASRMPKTAANESWNESSNNDHGCQMSMTNAAAPSVLNLFSF